MRYTRASGIYEIGVLDPEKSELVVELASDR
jgi:hypothetical protein